MKKVEYKTAKGAQIKVFVKTEMENLVDHNFKADCHDFVVEVAGFGRLSSPKLVDGAFCERFARTVNGKKVKVQVPASDEAAALYADYVAEAERRIEAGAKADAEYEAHYSKIKAAMAE